MVINLIGSCDKRPVLYTLMKLCQSLDDVLVISNSTKLLRLSDTEETGGHYQNTMIAVTNEGLDDFIAEFPYNLNDFKYVIIDNIPAGDANKVIYVKGMITSESEKDLLEYIPDYDTIELYSPEFIKADTMLKLEQFEAYKCMNSINANLNRKIASIMSSTLNISAHNIEGILSQDNPAPAKTEPVLLKKAKGLFKGGVKIGI